MRRPQTPSEPLTQAAIRREATAICDDQTGRLRALLAMADIPNSLEAEALRQLEVRLHGVRMLFMRWQPRPAVEPDEVDGFLRALRTGAEEITSGVVSDLAGMLETEGARAAGIVQQHVARWEKSRASSVFVRDDPDQPRLDPKEEAHYRRLQRERAQKEVS
jgi:hypothetical protein